jgi:hypothetical protein
MIIIKIVKFVSKCTDENNSHDTMSECALSEEDFEEKKPIIIAQCNLQILWLLKNKDLSHWIKLYAENHEEQLKG